MSFPELPPDHERPWRVTKRRRIYQNPWTILNEEELSGRGENRGADGLYASFAAKDSCIVCPLFPNGDTVVVRQWRQGFESYTWELPCGCLDEGDEPDACAQRELREECGLQARLLRQVATWWHSDSRVGGRIHAFLARKLAPAQGGELDASEFGLHCQRVPMRTVLRAINDGHFTHSSSVALCLMVATQMLPPLTPHARPL